MRLVAVLHAVLLAAVSIATSVVPAVAADQLVPGQKLVVKAAPGKPARLTWAAKAPTLVAPAIGSADDPRTTGATLMVVAASGESATFALPAAGWRQSGRKNVYHYKNAAAPSGPSAVKVALLRDGKITVGAKAAGITLDEPTQGSLSLVLTVGTTRYCTTFGGTVTRDRPGLFMAKKSAAPAACAGTPGGNAITWYIADGPPGAAAFL